MDINNFPVKNELKHEITVCITAYMAAIGIDVSLEQQQEFQDKHSEDLINSVLDAVCAWQEDDNMSAPGEAIEILKEWVDWRKKQIIPLPYPDEYTIFQKAYNLVEGYFNKDAQTPLPSPIQKEQGEGEAVPSHVEELLTEKQGKKLIFTREEVIKVIDDLLQRPDFLIEAVTNENTDTDAEQCLVLAEEQFN